MSREERIRTGCPWGRLGYNVLMKTVIPVLARLFKKPKYSTELTKEEEEYIERNNMFFWEETAIKKAWSYSFWGDCLFWVYLAVLLKWLVPLLFLVFPIVIGLRTEYRNHVKLFCLKMRFVRFGMTANGVDYNWLLNTSDNSLREEPKVYNRKSLRALSAYVPGEDMNNPCVRAMAIHKYAISIDKKAFEEDMAEIGEPLEKNWDRIDKIDSVFSKIIFTVLAVGFTILVCLRLGLLP